jgi:ABC-type nickel/cobalt efflux system permease component RcnA
MTGALLIATVAAVGILHTLVPDHWAPIVVLARQQGWSTARTARTAALAGVGHVTTTLVLGLVLWAIGATLAVRYAHVVSVAAAIALLVFGLWIAYGGWKELREEGDHDHGHSHVAHGHLHMHADMTRHVHWHEHHDDDWHDVQAGVAVMHEHDHAAAGRTALLFVLGSSPMIEGIPAFLAASTYGVGLLAVMAVVFAAATIVTYVGVSVAGISGLQRLSLGPLERYGEVISGVFVALVGVYALLTA